MPEVPFPYPGNKARLSNWILNYIPEHKCFVSVFGGAGGIIFNKERSDVEVYNDKDEDLVKFFTVLREREEELIQWLKRFPFSRKMHKEWADKFYDNRPFEKHILEYSEKHDADPEIVRAGIFFFLRYGQWGSKYGDNSGFAFSKVTNDADSFANARDRLGKFADRFDGVVIENLDWEDCMDNYDGEDTVFYLDPPYYKDTNDQHYQVTGFNHSRFVRYLGRTDAKWVLSYAKLPPGLDEYHIESKESNFMIGNGKSGEAKKTTEHLVTNFNPDNTPMFHSTSQGALGSYGTTSNDEDENKIFAGSTNISTTTEEETTSVNGEDKINDDEFDGMFEEIDEEREEKEKEPVVAGGLDKLDGIASNGNKSKSNEENNENDNEEDEWDGFLEGVSQ